MKIKIQKNKVETKTKIEFYWHIHHDILVEALVGSISNMRAFIEKEKPKDEIPLHLKLLKKVKGKLPLKLIEAGKAYIRAREAYIKALKAYDRAWVAHIGAKEAYFGACAAYGRAHGAYGRALKAYVRSLEAYMRVGEARIRAREAYVRSLEAYYKAEETYDRALKVCQPEIKILHEKECPNCPWNGKTILSGKS